MSNIRDKQAYLQGTHMSFDASERGLFGGILGGIDIALRPSRFPNASQNRQGVVKLVDMSPSQRPRQGSLPDRFRIPCQIPQTEDHRVRPVSFCLPFAGIACPGLIAYTFSRPLFGLSLGSFGTFII